MSTAAIAEKSDQQIEDYQLPTQSLAIGPLNLVYSYNPVQFELRYTLYMPDGTIAAQTYVDPSQPQAGLRQTSGGYSVSGALGLNNQGFWYYLYLRQAPSPTVQTLHGTIPVQDAPHSG